MKGIMENNNFAGEMVLSEERIIETVATLQRRIADRFPDSGLASLCGQLHEVACRAAERSTAIGKPIRWIQVSGYAIATTLVLSLAGLVILAVDNFNSEPVANEPPIGVLEWIQAFEAGLNDVVFFGIAIYFLISLENRIKRRRALAAIHELRAISHIIDMHQLTKDPERFWRKNADTKNSPKHKMTPFLLNRYLDYCSEMLSLTGKIAALYVQNFDDASAVAAVSEVEQLTTSLSGKIWQKIMVLEQARESVASFDEPSSEKAAPTIAPEHSSGVEDGQRT